ncbi:MAG: Co2+/Mg2+ efflux protein ApaG [Gammaproteobacteria bacterium RIFCSPHIGHO2_12_FULL_41_20]|nr:MAG: Co2+/Mg2+ efflux protein ApaG [Gammaproteobacteria bacterium RIFCSPHIGHO2_12_FULL_41_20]
MKKSRNNIVAIAEPSYLAAQSDPESQRFLWSYEVTISNEADEIVQLLNRYWKITDMTGRVEEVKGPGVVGLQPIIKPGKKFVYSSFCQLVTPQGTMEGNYEMQTLEEERFLVHIPKFILTAPSAITRTFRSMLH